MYRPQNPNSWDNESRRQCISPLGCPFADRNALVPTQGGSGSWKYWMQAVGSLVAYHNVAILDFPRLGESEQAPLANQEATQEIFFSITHLVVCNVVEFCSSMLLKTPKLTAGRRGRKWECSDCRLHQKARRARKPLGSQGNA